VRDAQSTHKKRKTANGRLGGRWKNTYLERLHACGQGQRLARVSHSSGGKGIEYHEAMTMPDESILTTFYPRKKTISGGQKEAREREAKWGRKDISQQQG